MPDRYVKLPNGSYLQWPEGVSAQDFRAKAQKVMGAPKPDPLAGSISAVKPPSGSFEAAERWSQQLINDLQNGTDITGVGAFMKKIGAQPLHSGQPAAVGDLLSSPYIGPLRINKGWAEIGQGEKWKGTKDVVGGINTTAEIPSMFMAPEAIGAAKGLLPSTTKAGKLIEAVERVAGHVPIDVNGPGREALEAFENSQHGGTAHKIIGQFLRRTTGPGSAPLKLEEARNFYENATRLSYDAKNRLNPMDKYLLGKFTKSLDKSIYEAAAKVGQGDQYAKAMRAYHSAARLERAAKATGKAAMAGAGLYGAYKAGKDMLGAKQ